VTEKERRFVEAYMGAAAGNAAKAAELAGYSPKSARHQASRLLTKRNVQDAIAERQARRESLSDVSAAKVVRELARIGFSDFRKLFNEDGSLKPFKDLDDDTAAAVAGVDVVERAGGMAVDGETGVQHVAMYTKKVKLWDKNSALDKIARHLGMFVERHEHAITVDVAGARARIASALARLAASETSPVPREPQR
jgi:phage terminase small subunit